MGLIRGGLLVFASVILFIGFLSMNSLLVVSNSLEYENIQKDLVPVATEIISEQVDIGKVIDDEAIEMVCENNSELILDLEERIINVSCESVEQGADAIINESINEFVEDVYYEDYDCGFIDCFGKSKRPYFLLSENTKDYFANKFYLVLLICLGIAVVMFFLVENKSNAPILVGALLIVASLPFFKLDSIAGYFADKSFFQFFTFLFTQSYFVAVKTIIIGFLLVAFGIVMKFFKIGFWISNFLSKFRRNNQKKGSASDDKSLVTKGKVVDVKKFPRENKKSLSKSNKK